MTIINGQVASADEVMNAFGSMFNDVAQNLFNAAYLGFDSRLSGLGTPNLNNTDYDIFTSDTATTTTNFTYDSSGDKYDVSSFTSSDAVLEVDFDDSLSSITNIIPVINGGFSKNYTSEITNNSFEDTIVSEWSTSGTGFTDTGRINTDSEVGTWSYELTFSSANPGPNGSLEQTVDLTDVTNIGCYARLDSNSSEIQGVRIRVDSTIIVSRAHTINGQSDADFVWFSGEIPSALRTTGKVIKLEVYSISSSGGVADGWVRIDYFDIWNINESIASIELTVDGSNYESVNNTEILRPTNTGTTPSVKVTLSHTEDLNPEIHYISEEAIKYNLY